MTFRRQVIFCELPVQNISQLAKRISQPILKTSAEQLRRTEFSTVLMSASTDLNKLPHIFKFIAITTSSWGTTACANACQTSQLDKSKLDPFLRVYSIIHQASNARAVKM